MAHMIDSAGNPEINCGPCPDIGQIHHCQRVVDLLGITSVENSESSSRHYDPAELLALAESAIPIKPCGIECPRIPESPNRLPDILS